MTLENSQTYTAFNGSTRLARGPLHEVVLEVKHQLKAAPQSSILVFSDLTGKEMDFDLRGSDKEVLQRLQVYLSPEASDEIPAAGPGRPKLGVIAREVSLLPRHWEWLSTQTGGASATLRQLVEDAKKNLSVKDKLKQAQERTYKFMSTMAGNLPNFEEAVRALYAKDKKKLKEQIAAWPTDIKTHVKDISQEVFE